MRVSGILHTPKKPGDVGYDLELVEDTHVWPGQCVWARTGVRLQLPEGVWCEIVGRSSTMHNYGIQVQHSIIDTGYTGELTVGLLNTGRTSQRFEEGTRLAQVIFRTAVLPSVQLVREEEIGETVRGSQGFGSTGR